MAGITRAMVANAWNGWSASWVWPTSKIDCSRPRPDPAGSRGPSLPAEEIAVAADRSGASVVAVSVVDGDASHRLHRAFSVFVLNDQDELLLQRRAEGKYHSGGLWSNTCCSHPRPGEATWEAAGRRLEEEMGFRCDLQPAFGMVYRADVGDGLVEYEYDHVLLGRWNGRPSPDPREVMDWCWVALDELHGEVTRSPRRFTCWFRVALLELNARGLLPAEVHGAA